MYCTTCGNELNDAHFCNNCGTPASSFQNGYPRNQSGLVGFSPRINDPAFASYKKKSSAWSFIFAFILAVIAVIGFPIYGNASGEIDWPNSLYYGLGIGGMFVVIALLQTIKRGVDKTWDGVVVYKDIYRERSQANEGHSHYHTVYVLKIRKDFGGTKKHKWRDSPGPYEYYSVGDKVRHNKGFYFYEKYDKSGDSQIMCAACMAFNDINADVCTKCKCPLLKV